MPGEATSRKPSDPLKLVASVAIGALTVGLVASVATHRRKSVPEPAAGDSVQREQRIVHGIEDALDGVNVAYGTLIIDPRAWNRDGKVRNLAAKVDAARTDRDRDVVEMSLMALGTAIDWTPSNSPQNRLLNNTLDRYLQVHKERLIITDGTVPGSPVVGTYPNAEGISLSDLLRKPAGGEVGMDLSNPD